MLQAYAENPNDPVVNRELARAYNGLGAWVKAEAHARAALKKDPDNPRTYEELAYALVKQGKFAEALKMARKVYSLDPSSGWAHVIAAMAHEGLGDHGAMIAELESATALNQVYGSFLKWVKNGGNLSQVVRHRDGLGKAFDMAHRKKKGKGGFLVGVALLIAGLCFIGWKFSHLIAPLKSRLLAGGDAKKEKEEREKSDAFMAGGGLKVGKFELNRILGKGGMAVVWEAKDTTLDRLVAVKKMSSDLGRQGDEARVLFVKEAQTVAALQHPDIVEIYEIIDEPTGLYIVFELVQGKTLHQILQEKKKLDLAEVVGLLKPVCRALEFAHGKGVVHRDLKPGNIMVNAQGQAKVMDFGIARHLQNPAPTTELYREEVPLPHVVGGRPDRTLHPCGTPLYMAPEAAQGLITPLSDVFALGVLMYELLTGSRPYGNAPSHNSTHLGYVKASERVPGLPPAVDDLIARALAPRKEDRMQSVREFHDLMAAVSGTVHPGAAPTA